MPFSGAGDETLGTVMTSTSRSHRARKIIALSAAGTVLAVGGITTLAAWNDSEWVWGGASSGGDPIGSSEFNVQQNREQAPTAASPWTDHGSMTDAGLMVFSPDAMALTPGDTAYAPVALRTTATSIAGEVTLQGAVDNTNVTTNDPDNLLWDAVRYSVKVTEDATECSAENWADFGEAVVTGATLATGADDAQVLAAEAGNIQYYCFQIELPGDAGGEDQNSLQGRTIAPAWEFAATSN